MSVSLISITNIPQLHDNYSYIMIPNNNNQAVIVDPAESNSIIHYIEKNQLSITAILLTHHHNDHTAGVKDILDHTSVPIYSPDKNIYGTSVVVSNGDQIDLNFIKMDVIETPGHTLDHIVFYNQTHNILFSGDTLFRLGCGRVFEGTYEQMFSSLKKIEKLNDEIMVYCGHEYTLNNLKFLQSIFLNHHDLNYLENKINLQLSKTKASIPFNLGEEKSFNPFLSSASSYYLDFKKNNKFTDLTMFSHLRDLKNNF